MRTFQHLLTFRGIEERKGSGRSRGFGVGVYEQRKPHRGRTENVDPMRDPHTKLQTSESSLLPELGLDEGRKDGPRRKRGLGGR